MAFNRSRYENGMAIIRIELEAEKAKEVEMLTVNTRFVGL